MLSRREALKGSAAVAVAGSVPSVTWGGASHHGADAKLLTLEQKWRAINDVWRERSKFYDKQTSKLPVWADSGKDQFGRYSGWPSMEGVPEFEAVRDVLSIRTTLGTVQRFNEEMCEKFPVGSKKRAAARARGRARVRAWIARYRQKEAMQRELGIDDWDEQADDLADLQSEIEEEIAVTPAEGISGLAVKLRMYAGYIAGPPDENEEEDLTVISFRSILEDVERLAGEA